MKVEINLREVVLKPVLISFLVKFDGLFRKKKIGGGLEHVQIKAVPSTCHVRRADGLPTALLYCV